LQYSRGIGIEPAAAVQMFQPFVQAGASTTLTKPIDWDALELALQRHAPPHGATSSIDAPSSGS
jgi:hypothetical protein